MPNDTVRFGRTGTQDEPIAVKKNAGAIDGKPEAAENINWFLDRVAAGANLDRRENCLLYMPLKNNLNIDIGVGSNTFARAAFSPASGTNAGTYIDRYGIVQMAAVDVPRFESKGLLVEGASSNLLLRSEEFDHGTWGATGTPVVVADAINAPDGTLTADTLEDDDAGTAERINQTITVANDSDIHFASIFLKRSTPQPDFTTIKSSYSGGSTVSAVVRLTWATGAISDIEGIPLNSKLETLNDDWFRLSFGLANNSSGNTSLAMQIFIAGVAGSGVGKIGAWGAQIEKLPLVSSYIPTVAASVTRAVDVSSVSISDNITKQIDPTTMLIDASIIGVNTVASQLAFAVAGETNRRIWARRHTISKSQVEYANLIQELNAPTIDIVRRYGLAFDGTTVGGWADGVNLTNGVPSSFDNLGTSIDIGSSAGTAVLFGHVSNFRIYDRAFIDQEMAVA